MSALSPDQASGSTSLIIILLTRLTVAFSRRRAYPESHPLVRTAETQAHEALAAVLACRVRLALSVGKDELLVDEEPAPFGDGVARDLAERLRQRGIGSLTFDRAVTPESLYAAIAWLAIEPVVADDGSVTKVEPPPLAGVTITRIAYGRLALGNEQSADHAGIAAIWRVLATMALLDEEDASRTIAGNSLVSDSGRASGHAAGGAHDGTGRAEREASHSESSSGLNGANKHRPGNAVGQSGDVAARAANAAVTPTGNGDEDATDGEVDSLGDTEPGEVGGAIERRMSREGYARRVAFVLLRVADQVSQAPAAQRAALGERLRSVLGALSHSSIGNIIKSVGVGADQRRFVSQVIDALPVGAIIEWLETAAQVTGQDLSHHLLRLMAKLSTRAQDAAASSGAETAFRDAARDLVAGWTLDDPNPGEHVSLLDEIARFETSRVTQSLPDAGAVRIVQIALEVDEFGEDAQDAAQQLLAAGRVSELMQWITEAPGGKAAAALQTLVFSPAAIKATLLREPLDQAMARALLASLDDSACETLLDVLSDAESRSTRRLVYDRLREYGPSLTAHLIGRLDGAPWYFVRNLLTLMRDTAALDAGTDVTGSTLFRFLSHQHEQVRVEALRLLVSDPASREPAIRHALDDRSERVVRVVIDLLGSDEVRERRATLASDLVQRLLRFIGSGDRDEELRARAVRALTDAAPSILVRDPLLAISSRRTLVFRRLVLAEARPVVLAALEVLAARYAADAKVAAVLSLAVRHPDARVRGVIAAAKRHEQAA